MRRLFNTKAKLKPSFEQRTKPAGGREPSLFRDAAACSAELKKNQHSRRDNDSSAGRRVYSPRTPIDVGNSVSETAVAASKFRRTTAGAAESKSVSHLSQVTDRYRENSLLDGKTSRKSLFVTVRHFFLNRRRCQCRTSIVALRRAPAHRFTRFYVQPWSAMIFGQKHEEFPEMIGRRYVFPVAMAVSR